MAAAVAPKGRVVTVAEPGAVCPSLGSPGGRPKLGWPDAAQPLVPQTAAPLFRLHRYFSMHTAGGHCPRS